MKKNEKLQAKPAGGKRKPARSAPKAAKALTPTDTRCPDTQDIEKAIACTPETPLANSPHRPSQYTPELATAICDLIAESKTLNQALKQLGDPVGRTTVFRWLDAHQAFRDMYARAHEAQGDVDADEIREIVRRVVDPDIDEKQRLAHNDARLAIDALKWSAAKRQPRKYGERVEVDTPPDGGIAKAVTVSAMAIAAIIQRGKGA